MFRNIAIFIVLLMALLATAYVVSHTMKKVRESAVAARPSGAIPVGLAEVKKGAVESTVTLQGTIRSRNSVKVVSKTSGRVVAKKFEKGNALKAGDVLYEVEKETAGAQKSQAEAGVGAAKAGLAQAQAGYKNAEAEYERAKALFREGSLSRQMFEKAEAGYLTASGALAAAEAGLRTATAALELATIAFDETTIRSPLAGRVVEDYHLETGAMITPGMPVAEVTDVVMLKAVAALPEKYLGEVKEGMLVRIRPEGYDGVIDAKVTMVNPSVNEVTRAAEVSAEFRSPLDASGREMVLPGQSCKFEMVLEREEGLVVPASAIVRRGEMDTVAVVEGGSARVVPVKTGLTTTVAAIVREGLSEGQKVVSSGARLIKMTEDKEGVAVTVE